jgi:hypothetical protein
MLFAISGNPLALVVVFAALAALIALWVLRRKSRIEEKLLEKHVLDRRKNWIEKELLEKPPAQPVHAEPATEQLAVEPPALTTPSVTPARTGVISPSRYQQAIFDELASGSGNVVVNAVAGSGKSTTIRQGVTKVRGRRILVSFNKNIAKENAEKLRVAGKTSIVNRINTTSSPRSSSTTCMNVASSCGLPI